MKKLTFFVFFLFALNLVGGNSAIARSNEDLQAVKKAVKSNPTYDPGKEAQWFKLTITDNKTKKDKVKIAVPLSLVEVFFKASHGKHFEMAKKECGIDFRELFNELKKIGPMAMIEVYEDDETIKIWLE